MNEVVIADNIYNRKCWLDNLNVGNLINDTERPCASYYHNLDEQREKNIKNATINITIEDFDSGEVFLTKSKFVGCLERPRKTIETQFMIEFYNNYFISNENYQGHYDQYFFHYPNTLNAINKSQSSCNCGVCNTFTDKEYMIRWGFNLDTKEDEKPYRNNNNVCLDCWIRYGNNYLTNFFKVAFITKNNPNECGSGMCRNRECNCLISKYDEDIRPYIEQKEEQNWSCEKWEAEEDAYPNFVCPSCDCKEGRWKHSNEPMIICGDCYAHTHRNNDSMEFFYADCDSEWKCKECMEENYFYCENCNEIHRNDDIYTTDDTNENYCSNCANDHLNYCERCNNYFRDTPTHRNNDGDWICEDCWDADDGSDQEDEETYEPRPAHRINGSMPLPMNDKKCMYCKEDIINFCDKKECRQKERVRISTYLEVFFNNELTKIRPITINHDPTEECCICMEEDCDCYRSCGHKFHRSCLNTWYRSNFSCPLCRDTKYF